MKKCRSKWKRSWPELEKNTRKRYSFKNRHWRMSVSVPKKNWKSKCRNKSMIRIDFNSSEKLMQDYKKLCLRLLKLIPFVVRLVVKMFTMSLKLLLKFKMMVQRYLKLQLMYTQTEMIEMKRLKLLGIHLPIKSILTSRICMKILRSKV